jgi:hypothetical protein
MSWIRKSQLAIEYSYRVRKQSQQKWVFWIPASNTAKFEAAYKNIAARVQLPRSDGTTANVLQLVYDWLCNEDNGQWLMIVDNADDESIFGTIRQDGQGAAPGDSPIRSTLASLLPQSDHGSILVTSRNRDVAAKLVGRDKDIIRIESMTQDQGVELLRNKLLCPLDEHASELLAALDYIPLAIAQAAAYINKCFPQMTLASYVRELNTNDKSRAKLLSQAANDLRSDGDASNSILTTWQITFERIREENPSAADLLSFMSFFNPQGVPGFLLYDPPFRQRTNYRR